MTGAKRELALDAYSEAMYPLHHYGWSDLRALRSGRLQGHRRAAAGALRHRPRSARETTNLFSERQALGDRMIAQLAHDGGGVREDHRGQPAVDVDPEARERLAALGYVGSFVASASDPRTGRADPKDKIELFNKLGTATDLSKDRRARRRGARSGRSSACCTRSPTEDPEVIDAWFMLGTQYLQHGEPAKAVEYFKRTPRA